MEMSFNAEEMFVYMMQNFNLIYWERFHHHEQLKHDILNEMAKLNLTPDQIEPKIPQILDRIRKRDIILPASINQLMDEKKENTIKIQIFKEVSVLSEGGSFGEYALMNSRPRTATIICKEDS